MENFHGDFVLIGNNLELWTLNEKKQFNRNKICVNNAVHIINAAKQKEYERTYYRCIYVDTDDHVCLYETDGGINASIKATGIESDKLYLTSIMNDVFLIGSWTGKYEFKVEQYSFQFPKRSNKTLYFKNVFTFKFYKNHNTMDSGILAIHRTNGSCIFYLTGEKLIKVREDSRAYLDRNNICIQYSSDSVLVGDHIYIAEYQVKNYLKTVYSPITGDDSTVEVFNEIQKSLTGKEYGVYTCELDQNVIIFQDYTNYKKQRFIMLNTEDDTYKELTLPLKTVKVLYVDENYAIVKLEKSNYSSRYFDQIAVYSLSENRIIRRVINTKKTVLVDRRWLYCVKDTSQKCISKSDDTSLITINLDTNTRYRTMNKKFFIFFEGMIDGPYPIFIANTFSGKNFAFYMKGNQIIDIGEYFRIGPNRSDGFVDVRYVPLLDGYNMNGTIISDGKVVNVDTTIKSIELRGAEERYVYKAIQQDNSK